MLPVFEGNNALLFYPVQYEGLESSKNIFYTGATTNQQIVPGAGLPQGEGRQERSTWSAATTSSRGPPTRSSRRTRRRTASRSRARSTRRWAPPTSPPSSTRSSAPTPDAVFNTLNGDSNVAFFKEYKNAGLTADAMPVVSRVDRRGGGRRHRRRQHRRPAGGLELLPDHRHPGEQEVRRRTSRPSTARTRSPSDPMEAAYTSVYLWKGMVEKAEVVRRCRDDPGRGGRRHLRRARGHGHGRRRQPPHLQDRPHRQDRAGRPDLHRSGVSGKPIEPDPYLKTYPWASGLSG